MQLKDVVDHVAQASRQFVTLLKNHVPPAWRFVKKQSRKFLHFVGSVLVWLGDVWVKILSIIFFVGPNSKPTGSGGSYGSQGENDQDRERREWVRKMQADSDEQSRRQEQQRRYEQQRQQQEDWWKGR